MHRILVVESDATWQSTHRLGLQRDGFAVATASSSGEALRIVPEWEPDLVVLDVRLGGDNGLDLLRRISGLRPSIRTVLLSAHPDYEDGFASWLADVLVDREAGAPELTATVRRLLAAF